MFGGASRENALPLMAVQLAALPALALGVFSLLKGGRWRDHKALLGLWACVVGLPLLYLLPLPLEVWGMLPGRDQFLSALGLSDVQPAALGATLSPDRTWQTFLGLLPPTAMLLSVLAATPSQRWNLVRLLLLLTATSVIIGVGQVAAGFAALYPFETTAPGSMVGLFANRNHLATLVLMCLPFAAAGLATGSRGGSGHSWAWTIFILLCVVALGVIRSRAGVIIAAPVLLGCVLIVLTQARGASNKVRAAVLIGAVGAAIALVGFFALSPLMDRFDSATGEGRLENWPIVLEAAASYLPLGSGLGSFDLVFRSVEPLDTLDPTYFNEAHNEYLQIWLEAGWLGAGLLLAILAWAARLAIQAWRVREPRQDTNFARAGSISLVAVALHSVVDYPLRTETILCVFALGLALLASSGQFGTRKP